MLSKGGLAGWSLLAGAGFFPNTVSVEGQDEF
jgi:hypothetical protein